MATRPNLVRRWGPGRRIAGSGAGERPSMAHNFLGYPRKHMAAEERGGVENLGSGRLRWLAMRLV